MTRMLLEEKKREFILIQKSLKIEVDSVLIGFGRVW